MIYNCSVTIHAKNSRNAYGEEEWGAGHQTKARVVRKTTKTIGATNEIELADIIVHLPIKKESYGVVGSKVVYDSVNYMIMEVIKSKNEVGHIRDVKLICKRYGEG
jgi:hypothetical protein